ncbi:MAG: glycosyltransferase family 39 protein [Planctomycetes bacterium]|nr:glycosyltransferase family 39 protein [Planctomycetota bacterium]
MAGMLVTMTSPDPLKIDRPLPAALPITPALTVLVSVAIAGLFVFSNLGSPPLADFDEAWHALIALDIERTGEFLAYTEDGRNTTASVKPPLYFWAMALCFRAMGPSEFAARFFPAACYVAMVAAVAWFVQRYLHWSVALAAAVLLATQFHMLHHHGARSAEIDPPLSLFLTLTMLWTYHVCRGGRAWPVGAFWCAALLTKGLAAAQVLPALGLWYALERRWRDLRRIALALAIGTIPVVGVFLLREQAQPGVLASMFGAEFIGRLAGEVDAPERQPFYFYAARLWSSLTPIGLGLAIVAAGVRFRPGLARQIKDGAPPGPLLRLLLIWTIVPLLLFSFAGTKRVWYAYPSLVPACILTAWILRAGLHRLESLPRNRLGPLAAAIVLGGQLVPAALTTFSFHRSDYQRRMEEGALIAATAPADLPAAPARVLCYRLSPSARFALKRGGIGYQRCDDPAAIKAGAAGSDSCIVIYSAPFESEVASVRNGDSVEVLCRCASFGLIVERWTSSRQ